MVAYLLMIFVRTSFRISATKLLSKSVSGSPATSLMAMALVRAKAGCVLVKAFVETERAISARAELRKSIVKGIVV